uniref:Bm8412, isoform b n=1 Tax=Brugia malayi TaxID=6279 RepID=A0A0J9Y790_BRUMA|nr:Bm8412, isoform b [Brugia malayi]
MYDLSTSTLWDTNVRDGRKENNCGKFSVSGIRSCLNKAVNGQRAVQDYISRLGNWGFFEWTISFQALIIIFNILSALAMSIVEYLNPWPMLLMAILLFIPIFPTLCSNQHEENLKFFGWTQLTCGFIELFWSSCVLLDMHYHSNDWRAYFTMFTVSWQFISIILISVKCPLLERIINGQRNQINAENSTATEPSSCNVDLRIAKLHTILNFEKQRSDERKKRRKERLKREECVKDPKEFPNNLTQSEEIDSRTAKDVSGTVNKISDLKATKEQNDKSLADIIEDHRANKQLG